MNFRTSAASQPSWSAVRAALPPDVQLVSLRTAAQPTDYEQSARRDSSNATLELESFSTLPTRPARQLALILHKLGVECAGGADEPDDDPTGCGSHLENQVRRPIPGSVACSRMRTMNGVLNSRSSISTSRSRLVANSHKTFELNLSHFNLKITAFQIDLRNFLDQPLTAVFNASLTGADVQLDRQAPIVRLRPMDLVNRIVHF